MPSRLRLACVVLASFAAASAASAASLYDESASGDLSNNGLSPTALSFSTGANLVRGSTGRGTAVDRDYFSFTLSAGQTLGSITVLPGTSVVDAVSFIGLQAGNQVTLPTNTTTAAGLLGWWHYGPSDVGTDILPAMAVASNGSSGFTTLGAGSYSVWIQDFGAGSVPYGFQFNVSAVPEPASAGLLALGLGLVGLDTRRRARR